MRILILATVILASCGDQGTNSAGSDDPVAVTPEVTVKGEPEATPTPAAQRAQAVLDALAVASAAELPACERNGQLVYALDVKQFFVCDGSAWVEIDIKGEKGEQGAQGEQGIAGATGPQGDTVIVEPDALGPSEWRDEMTSLVWMHTGAKLWNTAHNLAYCLGSYRKPTYAEIQSAVFHGMWVYYDQAGFEMGAFIWDPGMAPGGTEQAPIARGVFPDGDSTTQNQLIKAATFCVR